MLRFASFVGLAGILACGARTPLDDLERPASGGSGEGGSGAAPEGAGGEGAAGNAPPLACQGLVVDGLPLGDSGLLAPSERETSARLVAVDGQRAMLFHTLLDDNAEAASIRAATFDAWGPWPESLGPPNFLTGSVRSGALMAPGFAGDAALLLPLFSLGTPGAVTPAIATAVAPATPYMEIPYEYLFELPTMPGSGGSFATSKDGTAFAGWLIDAEGTRFLGQLVTDASGAVLDGPYFESGCASGRVVADTVAIDGGYIAAFSSGRGLGECLNDDGIPGPPTRLQVGWWRGGVGLAWQWEETLSEPIAGVALVPRDGGAWLVYQTDGSTSLTFPPVMAAPLAPDGLLAGDPIMLVEDGRTSAPFAAARFGSGLALAFVDALDPSAPTVIVRVFDAGGALVGEGSFNTSPAFLLPDALSLIASPSADALIVGWTSADDELRSVAARFVCVQPL